jgi:hypothetical protein
VCPSPGMRGRFFHNLAAAARLRIARGRVTLRPSKLSHYRQGILKLPLIIASSADFFRCSGGKIPLFGTAAELSRNVLNLRAV